MIKKENDCTKCPYFEQSRDYWGEWDEQCFCGKDLNKSCKLPIIIRHIIRFKKWLIEQYYYRKMDKAYKKSEKEWIKQGKTEDEYFS